MNTQILCNSSRDVNIDRDYWLGCFSPSIIGYIVLGKGQGTFVFCLIYLEDHINQFCPSLFNTIDIIISYLLELCIN